MNGSLIIFEGVDAVGKTTFAKLLVPRINGVYYKTSPESFRQRCVDIDSNGVIYSEERFRLYLESVFFASHEIKEVLAESRIVIVDRWIWTTLSYHFAQNPGLYRKWKDL